MVESGLVNRVILIGNQTLMSSRVIRMEQIRKVRLGNKSCRNMILNLYPLMTVNRIFRILQKVKSKLMISQMIGHPILIRQMKNWQSKEAALLKKSQSGGRKTSTLGTNAMTVKQCRRFLRRFMEMYLIQVESLYTNLRIKILNVSLQIKSQ